MSAIELVHQGTAEKDAAPEDSARPTIPPLSPSEVEAANADVVGPDDAQREAATLSRGKSRKELEEDAFRAEFGRSERFRNQFENLAIFALWGASVSVAVTSFIWLAHMIMPASWRWLTGEDLSHIQSIVTAGLLVGVIGNHFKKRLG